MFYLFILKISLSLQTYKRYHSINISKSWMKNVPLTSHIGKHPLKNLSQNFLLFKSKTARLLKLCHQYKTPTVAKKHFKLVK